MMNVTFFGSFIDLKALPNLYFREGVPYPEITFVGRSNVGKSSLINHLLRSKKIAKVSSTPGKTKLLNFFLVDQRYFLVDLPGYGFANASQEMKKGWGTTLSQYLASREQLILVCLLLDMRHLPTTGDLRMIEWLLFHQKKIAILLTKADKLSRKNRADNKKKIRAFLEKNIRDLPSCPLIEYSIQEAAPRIELMNYLKKENHGLID